jgi:hypothetical protein
VRVESRSSVPSMLYRERKWRVVNACTGLLFGPFEQVLPNYMGSFAKTAIITEVSIIKALLQKKQSLLI